MLNDICHVSLAIIPCNAKWITGGGDSEMEELCVCVLHSPGGVQYYTSENATQTI